MLVLATAAISSTHSPFYKEFQLVLEALDISRGGTHQSTPAPIPLCTLV